MTEQELTALANAIMRTPVNPINERFWFLADGYLALKAQRDALQAQADQLHASHGVVTTPTLPLSRCTCFYGRQMTSAGCPLHGHV